jgi:O-antigen/teichoic acid export membrane protein
LGLQFVFFPVALGLTLASAGASRVVPVLFALLAWQLQEVNRRGVLARGSYRQATIGDSVRYLGAFALAAVLAASGSLSLGPAFLLIGLTSLLAIAATPGTQLFRPLSMPLNFAHEALAYWRRGAPVLWATVLTAFFIPWFQWLLIWQHGLVAGAVLQALLNIAAIGRPVILGLENMLVPEIARQRETMSFRALAAFLWRCGGTALLLVAPLFAVVFVAPEWTLRLVYGEHSPYVAYPAALRLLMCTYVVYLAGAMFQATLKAYGANDGVLKMQLYAAIFGVTLGSYFIFQYGLIGACLAWFGSGTLTALIGLGYVLKLRGPITAASSPSRK